MLLVESSVLHMLGMCCATELYVPQPTRWGSNC
jgi:hypothetical protein